MVEDAADEAGPGQERDPPHHARASESGETVNLVDPAREPGQGTGLRRSAGDVGAGAVEVDEVASRTGNVRKETGDDVESVEGAAVGHGARSVNQRVETRLKLAIADYTAHIVRRLAKGRFAMKRHARGSAWSFFGALVGLALAAPLAGAPEDEQLKGMALIARAQSLEQLLAADTGPFHLRAHGTLFGMVGGNHEGEYLLFAASPGRWFEQIRFPAYSELSGLYEGQRWRKRNVVDKPFRFHELAQMLSPAYHLELPAEVRIGKLAQKEIAGTKAICIEASPTAALWQGDRAGMAAISPVGISKDTHVTLCFEVDSGLLRSATYENDLPRFEYEGQVTLGKKVFPRVLRCYEGKDLAVEATVEELVEEEVQDPAGFAPPSGADKWPHCANPEPPQLRVKKQPNTRILAHSRAHRQYGTVYCLAEVGTDGRIHDFTWLRFVAGGPAAAVKEAVQAWVYTPATCGGAPVPVTIYLTYIIPP